MTLASAQQHASCAAALPCPVAFVQRARAGVNMQQHGRISAARSTYRTQHTVALQVMAAGTLGLCYGNHRVFTGARHPSSCAPMPRFS
jgi:hypothetical protein